MFVVVNCSLKRTAVALILFMGAGVAPSFAQLVVERIAVRPNPAIAGQPAYAVVHVHNEGEQLAHEALDLMLNGVLGVRQQVELAAGERRALHLELPLETPGAYALAMQDQHADFELLPADSSLEQQTAAARHWRRRVIYNNDGGDSLYGQNINTWLDSSTNGLAGSNVDSIFYSTVGGLTFWHDTHAGQFVDRGVARALIERGTDVLKEQMKFCERNGMEFFWSMRMNDTHDTVDQWAWMMPQWKRDHPELMVGKRGQKYQWGANNWTALDYSHAPVREKIYDIIKDVAMRYDVDGIELDFFRGEPFFTEQLLGQPVTQAECDRMTELVRQLHELFIFRAAERGRPLLLAVRVPDSLGYAKAIGLDLQRWLDEGLVDLMISGGDRRFEPWQNLLGVARAKGVPLYACLAGDYLPQGQPGWEEEWRGHALDAWNAGVDGIYTFNFLQHRNRLFREIGDPAQLKALPSLYQFMPGTYWGFLKGEKDFIHAVSFDPAEGPFAQKAQVSLRFTPQPALPIHYTTDGTTPTAQSPRYKTPLAIEQDVSIRAVAVYPDGRLCPTITSGYRRAEQIAAPPQGSLPLNFFGTPNRTRLNIKIALDAVPDEQLAPLLYVTMLDVDAKKESLFFVNGHGPIEPPDGVLSGSMALSDTVAIPREYLQAGENTIEFVFDNLNEGTSGYIVYDCRLLFEQN